MNSEEFFKIVSEARKNGERPNLSGANLSGADLRDANLSGADLRDAKGIISIGPCGSREDMLYVVIHDTCVMVKAGCFWDTLDEFAAAVKEKHGDTKFGIIYRAAIEFIRIWEAEERKRT